MWIESEGQNKGSTVTFIIKLGLSLNDSDLMPKPRYGHGSADFSRHNNNTGRDTDGVVPPNKRYQRSF